MINKFKKKLKSKVFGVTKPKKTVSVKAEFLFNNIGDEAFTSSSGYYYVPWISSHGDRVMNQVSSVGVVDIAPLPIFKGIEQAKQRHKISRSIKRDPDLYRRYLWRLLAPNAHKIKAMCVSLDWNPAMRILVQVCRELGIFVNLIPHEAVFACRERYYKELTTGVDYPLADRVLAWGALQKEVFIERGYPEDRIVITGAPKFDVHHNYEPVLERHPFMKMYGLNPGKKTILFAAQPLDSQFDKQTAQSAQNDAISDLVRVCELQGVQLLVRMPPSDEQILSSQLRKKILESDFVSLDHASMYLSSPEESLFHCDVITSVNSTMLFEGVLMGKQVLSLKYVEFDSIWVNAGIPLATNYHEASTLLRTALKGNDIVDPQGMKWAREQFSPGGFDGQASRRVAMAMEMGGSADHFGYFEFMEAKGFGTLGFVDEEQEELGILLKDMFQLRALLKVTNAIEANSVDFMLQGRSSRFNHLNKKSQKPLITVTPFGIDAKRITAVVNQAGFEPIDFVYRDGDMHVTANYLETHLVPHGLDWQGVSAGDDLLTDDYAVGIVAGENASADLIRDFIDLHDGKTIAVFVPEHLKPELPKLSSVVYFGPATNRLSIAERCAEVIALNKVDVEGFGMLRKIQEKNNRA